MSSKEKLNTLIGADGQTLSPTLPENIKNYLIDSDGTITEDVPNEEPERMLTCLPFPDALEVLEKWYLEGHIITYFTSRTEEQREYTERWLRMHNIKYHALLMNKPRGGNYHWIDNHMVKATRFRGKFTPLVKTEKEIEVFNDDFISESLHILFKFTTNKF